MPGMKQWPEQTDRLKPAGADARTTTELPADVRRRLFRRHRVCVVNDPATGLQFREQGNHEIVYDGVGWNRHVEVAAECINRAVRSKQSAQLRLALLDESLVLPIHAIHVFPGGRIDEDQPPANCADIWIEKPT